VRIAAGILTIIGGFVGGSFWLTFIRKLITDYGIALMKASGSTDPALLANILGSLLTLIGYLPMGLAVLGGIYTLKRQHWGLALTGAICSLLFPFFGIPALILIVKSKGDFSKIEKDKDSIIEAKSNADIKAFSTENNIVSIQREFSMSNINKKCPYCGQPLPDSAFKCSQCKKWVPNELFNRLCAEDIKLIKDKDLAPYTPSLLAMMVIGLLQENDSLEQYIQKQNGKNLDDQQRYNLLVFESFCYWEAILFAKEKQGCRKKIMDTLMYALLEGITDLFNSRVKRAQASQVLIERGKTLYTKFQLVLSDLGTNASSQLKASNALGTIVFADDSPISFLGLTLYSFFMETFKSLGKEFSQMFLVEEEDFDWQAIVGKSIP